MNFLGNTSTLPREIRHYQPLKQVGQGTFGTVYKALDTKTNKFVALKVMEPKSDAEKRSVQEEIRNLKTVHEAVVGASLKHVVGFVDAFIHKVSEGQEQSIIVLEYVEFDLSALLELGADRLSFSKSQIKCIMKGILEGLSTLASCSLMHRDLKVLNVLLTSSGHAKLGDLGSATNFNLRQRFSSEVVTLWYRAPELLLGAEQYDHRIDVWSAAVVFVELCLCESFVRGNSTDTQLFEFCKMLGVPETDELQQFKHLLGPTAEDMISWARSCQDASLESSRASLWERLRAKIDSDGVDLLKRMFSFNPLSRPSAAECLQHPFFTSAYPPAAPRVLLPSDLQELHSWEHAACRTRREQQRVNQQLLELKQKRDEQKVRKLSPEHTQGSITSLLPLRTAAKPAPPVSSVNSPIAPLIPVPQLAPPVLPSPTVALFVAKRKKNLHVTFALERNERRFYCPKDAPTEVSSSRRQKRAREDETDDYVMSQSKRAKLSEQDDMEVEEASPFPAPRKLPRLIIKGGQVVLEPLAAPAGSLAVAAALELSTQPAVPASIPERPTLTIKLNRFPTAPTSS